MSFSPQKNYWTSRARRLALRINCGWILAKFAPLAFGITLFALPVLVWLRADAALAAGSAQTYFWISYVCVTAIAAGIALVQTRKKFETISDAFVRLDNTLRLHNRLTSAHTGIGDWPPIPTGDGIGAARWKLQRAGGLILSCIALLALTGFVQPSENAPVEKAPEIPPALADIRTWTKQLDEQKIVDPKALEALEEKLEALIKSTNDWYKSGTLEAAEHLREQTAQTLQNLDKDLAAIEKAVAYAQTYLDSMPEPLAEALQQSVAEALQGLDLSALPLNALQRDALRNLDMKTLVKMTPAQLKELAKLLKNNRRSLSQNGAMKAAGASKSKQQQQDKRPVYLFAAGTDPIQKLTDLVTPKNALAARTAFQPMSPAEKKIIAKLSEEGKLMALPEQGATGVVDGFILLPNPAGIPGIADEIDETAADALMTLVQDPSMVIPLTENERSAVLRMLREKRLRLDKFTINPGNCNNPGPGSGGQCEDGSIAIFTQSAGQGGRGGGPSAPLTFDRTPQNLAAGRKEALNANDRSHDALGDVQGVGTGKHKVDERAYTGATGGGAASLGEGGDSAWTDNLSPEERATLKEYFK